MGYLAFLDPPKSSAKDAITALKNYGVTTKILTGDNEKTTRCTCRLVGLPTDYIVLGPELEKMTPEELSRAVEENTIFAKLSPDQKAQIVTTLRENGHVTGFLGDGINDAPAMKCADIGISVNGAADIAKESADIILLEKSLLILEQGILEGRKTYANMIKYIKMTASSNFGNMFSVLAASALLPFLPMARRIAAEARKTGKDFLVVSRSDSTLRGFYPLETETLRQTLEGCSEKRLDGEVLMPISARSSC